MRRLVNLLGVCCREVKGTAVLRAFLSLIPGLPQNGWLDPSLHLFVKKEASRLQLGKGSISKFPDFICTAWVWLAFGLGFWDWRVLSLTPSPVPEFLRLSDLFGLPCFGSKECSVSTGKNSVRSFRSPPAKKKDQFSASNLLMP